MGLGLWAGSFFLPAFSIPNGVSGSGADAFWVSLFLLPEALQNVSSGRSFGESVQSLYLSLLWLLNLSPWVALFGLRSQKIASGRLKRMLAFCAVAPWLVLLTSVQPNLQVGFFAWAFSLSLLAFASLLPSTTPPK